MLTELVFIYINSCIVIGSDMSITGSIGGTHTACCGGGGPYNYNASAECGSNPLVRACDDPSQYVSWDGVHLTEAAYRLIADAIIPQNVTAGYSYYYTSK
jgi:hypothetical protein